MEVYTFNLARSLQMRGIEVAVLLPNFEHELNDSYYCEGIRVMRFAENSQSNRGLIMGKRPPDGLKRFIKILEEEKPDILHFQELSAGRGIGLYHLAAAADLKIKILLTCHLSAYSCQTGNLVYKEEKLCDGIIRRGMCTACSYQARGITGIKATLLKTSASLLYVAGINATQWNSTPGTALGFPFLIDKKKKELVTLSILCDRIVVLTKFYGQILEANGVPVEKIFHSLQGLTGKAIGQAAMHVSSHLRLVFVGRVSKYKGVHLLLEALHQLPIDAISLDIYGPVTEDEYGQDCVKESANMPNVKWKGSLPNTEVINKLSGYDLLCLPSTFSEMSPLVIQEAFAAGLPVLASNVYGNAEQIRHGLNGWLFEFKNATALKEQLQLLINDASLIDEAKMHLPATRSFDEVAKEHIELYESLVTKTQRSTKKTSSHNGQNE